MTTSGDTPGPSDADLIASVRAGRIEEYGTLYERHAEAAVRLARHLCRSGTEADDLVAESFAKVLDALRDGKGPDSAFRAYLLATVRHTAYGRARAGKRLHLTDDVSAVGGTVDTGAALAVPFADPAVADLERSLAARAFARLPERWQAVLWHTVVERQSPADVAPLLGMTPSAVSSLAYRAREGLRQEYLQAHLAEVSAARCRATAARLGAWTRDGLSRRERVQVEHHLDGCARCRALADELADVNASLRGVLPFLVLGGAALPYLADSPVPAAAATGAGGLGPWPGSGPDRGASGSAGALDRSPRQFLGVAVSGVAMATAIAVALTVGGGMSGVPVAHDSPPQVRTPTEPAPTEPPTTPPGSEPPPQPPLPPIPIPQPDPGSYRPPEPPDPVPAAPPPPPSGARPPTAPYERPEPAPGQQPEPDHEPRPRVTARGPEGGVTLTAGGPATDLPITVRNGGDAPAERAVLTLTLPESVSAVAVSDSTDTDSTDTDSGGSGTGGTHATGPGRSDTGESGTGGTSDAPRTVACPGGTGTVTCSLGDALGPGESVVLRFRLDADVRARSGTARAVVDLAGADPVRLVVPVTVESPPDVAHLAVSPVTPGNWVLSVALRNDGLRERPASLRVDHHVHDIPVRWFFDCEDVEADDTQDGALHCASRRPLRPGETARLLLVPHPHPDDLGDGLDITVTATVGSDSVATTVRLELPGPPWPPEGIPEFGPEPVPEPSPAPGSADAARPDTERPDTERPGTAGPAWSVPPDGRPRLDHDARWPRRSHNRGFSPRRSRRVTSA